MRLRLPAHLEGNPEAEMKLREVLNVLRANPLYGYNNPDLSSKLHRKQLAFNKIKAPVLGTKAMIAGNRSGKSFGNTADDTIQVVDPDDVPPHLADIKKFDPPVHIWVGAPKYTKHEDTTIPQFRKLLPKSQLKDGSFDRSYSSHTRQIKLLNGSLIGLKTYDQDIDAWASAEIHRIRWDEEPNNAQGRQLRKEARARLVSTGGDEVLGMTPVLGISTWAFDEIWERRHEPDITVCGMSMTDNPWNTKEAIDKYLAGLTAEERRAREHGEFVHFGGLFFDEFRQLHIVPKPPLEALRKMEIVVAIDPGLVHTGVVWIAFDSDNAAVAFAEHFPPKTIVPEIADEIKARNAAWKLPEPVYIIDPSYRNLTTEIHADAVQAAYQREEIFCQEGQNDRRAGILEIKRRLQAKDGKGDPCPTLTIADSCPQLIKQVERYRRDPDAADEWQAVPQDDRTRFDLVDGLRYGLLSRSWFVPELEERPKRRSYDPTFEPPLDLSEFLTEAPPMGDAS